MVGLRVGAGGPESWGWWGGWLLDRRGLKSWGFPHADGGLGLGAGGQSRGAEGGAMGAGVRDNRTMKI